jgi:hypothetical protein
MGFEILTHKAYLEAGDAGAGASADASAGAGGDYVDQGQVKQVQVPYTKCKNSLMWTTYNALFFSARKK